MNIRRVLAGLGALSLLVLVLAAVAFLWLRVSGRPVRSGEFQVAGLEGPVEVRWDRWGVPHVKAENETDLAFAQGYLHANDRLVQMEVGRRAAFGRLAEVFGKSLLRADIYFRTLRLGAAADAMVLDLGPRSRRWLDAYGRGVNAWLGERRRDLPPELRFMAIKPEPWAPRDSMAFALLMAHNLSFWDDRPEEERFHWLASFGMAGLRDLTGREEIHLPEGLQALARSLAPGSRPVAVSAGSPVAPGSNSWALAPERGVGGAAVVANDPHLGLGLPAVWYQMMLRSPSFEVSGMSLPGAPGIVIGRGPKVAWAFTNTMLDDHDLFLEELDATGRNYRRGGVWVPLEVEQQEISVRGGSPHALTLRSTERGPLLEADEERGLPPRSLAWTAYKGGDPLGALRRLSQAANPWEAMDGLATYICPAQNLVAAFASGEILFTVLGRVPDRLQGDGLLPTPGWDQSYGWRGLRPRDGNPTVLNPSTALLVTANSDNRPSAYPLAFPADYDTDHRRRRIVEGLGSQERWDVEGIGSLQTDVSSLYAKEVLAALGEGYEGSAARALALLRSWDARMDLRGPAALYALLQRNLMRLTFADEAKEQGLSSISSRARLLRALQGEMERDWWDDVGTQEEETRRQILSRALEEAWAEALERWGDRPEDWNYGALHTLTLRHPLEGVPWLGGWLRRGPFEMPGSATTVAAFGARWIGEGKGEEAGFGQTLDVTYGPSMRWVVDWSRPDRVYAALPGGQSGHPKDPHYDDRIAPYLAGELQESFWAEDGIARATVSRLLLIPSEGRKNSR